MSRRGENIYKRKDGRWEGRYIKEYGIDGKARYGYVYGKSYSEAKAKLKSSQIAEAILTVDPDKGATTYEVVLNLWLTASQINVKESTYARYYQLVKRHIIPSLGKYPVSKIGTPLIEQYVNHLLYQGRLDGKGGLSPKTVTDIVTIVKSSIDYARRNSYPIRCDLSKISVKKSSKEIRVLSVEEQKLLNRNLLTDTDLTKFGVLLSLYTGIRIGEICALRWEHLSVDRGVLEIRETLQRVQNTSGASAVRTRISLSEPKSKCSIRDIPLPGFIIDLARNFESSPKSFVLTGEKSRYVEPRTMQNRFKKHIEACDIPEANFHALRHTFATRCIEQGFEIKSLSEILGHANVNITLNRYVHSSFELKKMHMERLDALAAY